MVFKLKEKKMLRKTNFAHIAIRDSTKKNLEELKKELEKNYKGATYDELINIILEKNKKIILSSMDVKKIISKSRGVFYE